MSPVRALAAFLVIGCAAAAAYFWLAPKRPSPVPPHVILISVDTLRPDHLGCYGYGKATSPHIDRLASESALFENAFAHAPMTGPSCASFLSGFLPHETKVFQNNAIVPEGVGSVAETLQARGYETRAVICNYVLREGRGFEQGFDVYDAELDAKEHVRDKPERIAANATTRAIEMLGQRVRGRLFLWVHYQDPHGPYTPPAPFDTLFSSPGAESRPLPFGQDNSGKGGIPEYQRLGDRSEYADYVARYDGEIRYLDEQIGRLLAALEERGLYDTSLILFTADHGEAFGESGYYFAHGHRLDRCLIHVPLLVKRPGTIPGRSQEVVQHLDIVPTILGAAGIAAWPGLRGRDLATASSAKAAVLSELRDASTSLIKNGMKLVFEKGDTLLYDVLSDPGEERNLAREPAYAGRLEGLARALERLRAEDRLGIAGAPAAPRVTPEEEEALRALGYVD